MRPAVSIVVPIYNVEKFLVRCINSLISQTLINIEIVLVNDGSTDQSRAIADELSLVDKRIKVIHKDNGGLSSARNEGIERSTGEYIGFVDADDWVDNTMFERLYISAIQKDADVCISGGFCKVDESGNKKKNPLEVTRLFYEGEQIVNEVLMPMIGNKPIEKNDISIEMGVTLNIYKRELLMLKKIRFESEREFISEDIIFNMEVLTKIKRLSVVNSVMYYYWTNTQSLTQSYKANRFNMECTLYEYLKNKLDELDLLNENYLRLLRTFIGRARVCIVKEVVNNKQASFIKRIKNIRDITQNSLLIEVLKDYPISKYKIKIRLVTYLMKFHLAGALFFVLLLFYKKK